MHKQDRSGIRQGSGSDIEATSIFFLNIFTSVLTEQCLSSAWTDTNAKVSKIQHPDLKCVLGVKISVSTSVLRFHHSRPVLKPINIWVYCRVIWLRSQCWLYSFTLKRKSRCRDFCPVRNWCYKLTTEHTEHYAKSTLHGMKCKSLESNLMNDEDYVIISSHDH